MWRSSTNQARALLWFSIGQVAGGLSTATALVILAPLSGWLATGPRLAILTLIAVVLILRDLSFIRVSLPQATRLVPRTVFQRHGWVAALQFGYELGTGVRTYLSSSAPYLLAAAILLGLVGPAAALAAGMGFGIGRTSMILFRYWSREQTSWDGAITNVLPAIRIASLSATAIVILWMTYRTR